MQKSEQIDLLAAALVKAQAELKNPSFDSQNPHFRNKYASLATVRDTVTPTLAKNGLSVVQLIGQKDGGITCETVLLHISGQWLSEAMYMPATKQDAQGYGSAITYARRYSLMAICGVVGDEDDDGNAAANNKVKPMHITPTTGAKDALTKEEIAQAEQVASKVTDWLTANSIADAVMEMENADLTNEQRVYVWTFFDSKQRAAMKKEHEAQKSRLTA